MLKIKVIPNSRKFEVCGFNSLNELKIKLKSNAEKGKANNELMKELGSLLNTEIEIVKGKASRKKIITVQKTREEVFKALKI